MIVYLIMLILSSLFIVSITCFLIRQKYKPNNQERRLSIQKEQQNNQEKRLPILKSNNPPFTQTKKNHDDLNLDTNYYTDEVSYDHKIKNNQTGAKMDDKDSFNDSHTSSKKLNNVQSHSDILKRKKLSHLNNRNNNVFTKKVPWLDTIYEETDEDILGIPTPSSITF
ncbi:hypothetical protein NGRA_1772 [Nosema granulosis]|uniref:Uncharacterized protein n=1 Tax=Nosema granulosis TaxID=83296 RepID=A0A9P6GY95_9MICR|nr:hypothetical protein NGRA_1772 [Nosema granulosis]